jgi:hypothetical protein
MQHRTAFIFNAANTEFDNCHETLSQRRNQVIAGFTIAKVISSHKNGWVSYKPATIIENCGICEISFNNPLPIQKERMHPRRIHYMNSEYNNIAEFKLPKLFLVLGLNTHDKYIVDETWDLLRYDINNIYNELEYANITYKKYNEIKDTFTVEFKIENLQEMRRLNEEYLSLITNIHDKLINIKNELSFFYNNPEQTSSVDTIIWYGTYATA